jgi:Fe-S-cluster containining protein
MAVRVLSFHRAYACRDSGVCCSSSWPIPVESDRLIPLRQALIQGGLSPASGSSDAAVIQVSDAPPETPAVLGVADGRCVFYDARERHHCRIQHALGHAALPLACRQFPRVTVRTPTAVSVTLSHYCPTAAELLATTEPVSIVTNTTGFPDGGEYIGLDARDSLPPLLCADVLMDWDSWNEWERRSVDLLCSVAETPNEGLARLHTAVESARRWRPGTTPLSAAIDSAFDRARHAFSQYERDDERRVAEVMSAIPLERRRDASLSGQSRRASPDIEKRFLAAHAFASWTAYLGRGLRSWFRGVEAASALLAAGCDAGQADLLLRHLADTPLLVEAWNQAER